MCRLVFVFFLLVTRPPPKSPLFPYTTLFRSRGPTGRDEPGDRRAAGELRLPARFARGGGRPAAGEHSGPCARCGALREEEGGGARAGEAGEYGAARRRRSRGGGPGTGVPGREAGPVHSRDRALAVRAQSGRAGDGLRATAG